MDTCGDGFEHLYDATASLDTAVDDLIDADSFIEGGHAAAEVLDELGLTFEGVVDGVCMEGLGEELEDIGRSGGEIIEAGAAIMGEVVELFTEGSLAVAEPLITEMGELLQDAGEALDSAIDAIDHAMTGEIGEAAASAAGAAGEIPDALGDIAETIPEIGVSAGGEFIEGVIEIGGEVVEGICEITGFTDDNKINGGDRE
jgi:hypothetical protein